MSGAQAKSTSITVMLTTVLMTVMGSLAVSFVSGSIEAAITKPIADLASYQKEMIREVADLKKSLAVHEAADDATREYVIAELKDCKADIKACKIGIR